MSTQTSCNYGRSSGECCARFPDDARRRVPERPMLPRLPVYCSVFDNLAHPQPRLMLLVLLVLLLLLLLLLLLVVVWDLLHARQHHGRTPAPRSPHTSLTSTSAEICYTITFRPVHTVPFTLTKFLLNSPPIIQELCHHLHELYTYVRLSSFYSTESGP